ncbi:class I adenylate-forming enzyme family protein [Nocardia takedensis]
MTARPTVLHTVLAAALRAAPEARVRSPRVVRTFAELSAESAVRAAALDALAPRGGSRVLIATANHPDYVATLLAVLSRADLPILADPGLGAAEIDTLVAQCGIDVVVSAPVEDAEPGAVPLGPDACARATGFAGDRPKLHPDTELGRLTSGSTRAPACIEFTAEAVLAAARTWARAADLSSADVSLCFAGLYNGLAFNTTLIPSLLVGADIVLPGGMPGAGAILRHVAATRPSILVAFPAAYERLTDYAVADLPEPTREALRGIRLRLSSAAPLSRAVAAHVAELSGPISDYYGIAETGPVTFSSGRTPGSNGAVLPGVTVDSRANAEGVEVLHVRTASMGTRYLNYPGEFERAVAADGSYVTSDTGTVTDGELRLGERAQPILNIGGRKFTVDSVRDAIGTHPHVRDSRVLGLTTPSGRDCVGALVEADADFDVADLRTHLRERLADYKVPEVLRAVPGLPRGTTGKVKAAAVRELLMESFSQPATGGH